VERSLKTLEKNLASFKSKNEQCIDSEALNEITKVIMLQDNQLRFQSSKFFIDPETIRFKFRKLPREKLAEVFVSSWHPILGLEQLTSQGFLNAFDYWHELLPISERLRRPDIGKPDKAQDIDVERLNKMGIISEEEFFNKLEKLWKELKEKHSTQGEIEYWKFIFESKFSTTIDKAYLLSFLITNGYVGLIGKGKDLFLIPNNKKKKQNRISFPISISKKDWSQWQNLEKEVTLAGN
jgi:hypothetical protein